MLATLNSIAFHAGVLNADRSIDDLRMLRIRDAYLEAFTSLGSREELLRWAAQARSTGCVTRAISWETGLQDAPATVVVGEEFPVRGWLRSSSSRGRMRASVAPAQQRDCGRGQPGGWRSSGRSMDVKTAYMRPRLT